MYGILRNDFMFYIFNFGDATLHLSRCIYLQKCTRSTDSPKTLDKSSVVHLQSKLQAFSTSQLVSVLDTLVNNHPELEQVRPYKWCIGGCKTTIKEWYNILFEGYLVGVGAPGIRTHFILKFFSYKLVCARSFCPSPILLFPEITL